MKRNYINVLYQLHLSSCTASLLDLKRLVSNNDCFVISGAQDLLKTEKNL